MPGMPDQHGCDAGRVSVRMLMNDRCMDMPMAVVLIRHQQAAASMKIKAIHRAAVGRSRKIIS